MLPATFALRILEKYLWRKGSLIISQREHSYIYFSWILISSEPNKMVWATIASIQVILLLERCSFFVIYKLYVISWVWPWMYFEYVSYEDVHLKIIFQFWETEKSGFFSSLTASVQSETCSSLNLKKVCWLINSYLLNMMIFIQRLALQKKSH